MVPETERPVYERALELLDQGYQVAMVPITTTAGDTGVFLKGFPMGTDHPAMRRIAFSHDASNRLSLAVFVLEAAHKELPNGYWPV